MLHVQRVAELQDGLITAGQCYDIGLSVDQVRGLVRSRVWRPLCRGVYLVDSDLRSEPLPDRMLIRAAALGAGPHATVVLHSAAILHGIQGVPSHRRLIHLSMRSDHALPRRVGDHMLVPHQLSLRPTDITSIDGIRATTPLRTVADLILCVDRMSAVSILDSALFLGLIGVDQLEPLLWRRRGAVQARGWLALADERAESPLETRARLRCVDARIPPDLLQAQIGQARVDMLWEQAKVIGEADGVDVHSQPEALFNDRERQNELVAAGFVVVRFTWADTLDPERIPRVVRRAAARGHR